MGGRVRDHTPGDSGYHLAIEGFSCHRPALWCTNSEILRGGRKTRGENEELAGVDGARATGTLTAQRKVDLEFTLFGAYALDGEASTDREITLQDNILGFEESVVYAPGDDYSQLSVVLTGKGGRIWLGLLQVNEWTCGKGLEECNGSLTVTLPAGFMVELGS